MKERSARKLATVTTTDVERILADAANVRDEMTDALVLIGAGVCERLDNPLLYARKCMNVSRLFADATSHFLCRLELQERTHDQ